MIEAAEEKTRKETNKEKSKREDSLIQLPLTLVFFSGWNIKFFYILCGQKIFSKTTKKNHS